MEQRKKHSNTQLNKKKLTKSIHKKGIRKSNRMQKEINYFISFHHIIYNNITYTKLIYLCIYNRTKKKLKKNVNKIIVADSQKATTPHTSHLIPTTLSLTLKTEKKPNLFSIPSFNIESASFSAIWYNKINLCNEDHRQLCNGVVLNYTPRCSEREIIGFNLHRICYTFEFYFFVNKKTKKSGMKFGWKIFTIFYRYERGFLFGWREGGLERKFLW